MGGAVELLAETVTQSPIAQPSIREIARLLEQRPLAPGQFGEDQENEDLQ